MKQAVLMLELGNTFPKIVVLQDDLKHIKLVTTESAALKAIKKLNAEGKKTFVLFGLISDPTPFHKELSK